MKYLCLICPGKTVEQMSEAYARQCIQEYAEFTADIKSSGHFVMGSRLEPADNATTIRVRNGQTLVTDGPFAETKEQVGGFYMIEADGKEEAIQIAARIPGAQFGSVELRPVADDA